MGFDLWLQGLFSLNADQLSLQYSKKSWAAAIHVYLLLGRAYSACLSSAAVQAISEQGDFTVEDGTDNETSREVGNSHGTLDKGMLLSSSLGCWANEDYLYLSGIALLMQVDAAAASNAVCLDHFCS